MTFRTFEIDAAVAAPSSAEVASPVRSVRSRRRALSMTHRSSGARITGFGF